MTDQTLPGTPPPNLEHVINEWHRQRFGNLDARIIGCKLAEETGEVCGALIKAEENRADRNDLFDELGDLLIVASVIAGRHGQTLDQLRNTRWATVAAR